MPESQTKICQNCKQSFVIEPDNFAFYEKMRVPPPTWCPECRLVRRMLFLNERSFYRRTCDLCKSSIISRFPVGAFFPVYCAPCWWSEKWDPMDHGRDYDFSRPFFTQYNEFLNSVPHMALESTYTTMVNSDYCNIASYLKNCYFLVNSDYDEDSFYSTYLERSKHASDIYMGIECERCYEASNLERCFEVFYSWMCNDCIDVWFSRNMRNCSHCFGCVNLRNKQYCIFNEQYTKEAYEQKLRELDFSSYAGVQQLKERVKTLAMKFPRKYYEGHNNKNVSGNFVFNSRNAHQCYEVGRCEDVKFCQFLFMFPTSDSYDMTMWGGNATRIYECMAVGDGENNVRFSFDCWANAMNLEFCQYILVQNNNLFACYGTRKKEYCIFNKQYTKEGYEEMVTKIKKHMDEMPYVDVKGRTYKYGEFFPPELSQSGYNETLAQVFFPLTQEEAKAQGFRWEDTSKERGYKVTMKAPDLPQRIGDVKDSILSDVIECKHNGTCEEQCSTAFRITPQELKFYRELGIPLPRLCPNCRHYERLAQRNPLKLWHRKCQCAGTKSENGAYTNTVAHPHGAGPCPSEFETSYDPHRKEIVYCEACYQAEVV